MQKILKGYENIHSALANVGARRYMLVCDAAYPHLFISELLSPYVVFNHFGSNPLYEDVCRGVDLFNREHCDALVAVGGGSSIDVAKCIKLYCKMDARYNYLQQEAMDSGTPLIAVPTTAGTGSESTRFAVIYFEGMKQSVTHDSIIPDYAILEPRLLETLPDYQRRCTFFDALCQAIESLWSVNSTEESRHLSIQALQMLNDNAASYLQQHLANAAEQVMTGANLAGQAINLAQTTAPHAFSYKLTSMYGLPHGHAVAIAMSEIWQYMLLHPEKCIDPRGGAHLQGVMNTIAETMHYDNVWDAMNHFQTLIREYGMTNPHSATRGEDIEVLTHSVNPVRLKNHPIELDEATTREIYERIVHERIVG